MRDRRGLPRGQKLECIILQLSDVTEAIGEWEGLKMLWVEISKFEGGSRFCTIKAALEG